jgi:hypothetical protein
MKARLAGAIALILVIIGLAGCGSSKGHETALVQAHDLVVDNYDPHFAVTIYVDGASIGDVPADGRGYFWVVPGLRTVHFVSDETLPDGSYRTEDVGQIVFRTETETHISYVP